MVRLFVRHAVNDYESWKKVYDAFDSERPGFGVTGQAVFQSVDDPNDVTVWHDFASRESAETFASSPRLQEVMKEAGVASKPDAWFVTQA